MSRLERLLARRLDPREPLGKTAMYEAYRFLDQSEAVKFALGSMQPVEEPYTRRSFEQGERVRKCLAEDYSVQSCDFKYQGSVTNGTHIKAVSDIDLVVLTKKFSWVLLPLVPVSPYSGDVTTDMKTLREQCVDSIRKGFPQVTIDNSGGKAVKITGGSLTRDIDVVPAAWLDTEKSNQLGEDYRGIELIDANTGSKVSNFPWFHNLKIEERDRLSLGGMRKAARLMKSLKADSSNPKEHMSSYDIVSIAYNIPECLLAHQAPYELRILQACRDYCAQLQTSPTERARIEVPNGTRKVFCSEGASITQLDKMLAEIERLIEEIRTDARRSFQKLAEARVEYPLVKHPV